MRRWRLQRWFIVRKERLIMWVAWHLPRELVKWAYVRLTVAGTPDDESPEDLRANDALKAWEAN